MGMESERWCACVDPVHSLLRIIHKSRGPTLVFSAANDKTGYCERAVRNIAILRHDFVSLWLNRKAKLMLVTGYG